MTAQPALTRRIAALFREHQRRQPSISEREATELLRPHGQGVKSAPALAPLSRPLNHARPSADTPNGTRVQQPLSDAESTG